jgi:hypothetical protein
MVGSRDGLPITENNVSPRAAAQRGFRSGRLGEIQLADLNRARMGDMRILEIS